MRYDHINIGVHDVERMADFYERVFNCTRLSEGARMSGALMARGMGLQDAEINAVWLRLPGHGEEGPFLELFEYSHALERPEPFANRQGYNHIGFEVHDVEAAVDSVVAAGGVRLGEIVDFESPTDGVITFVFVRDPEENIVQLVCYPK